MPSRIKVFAQVLIIVFAVALPVAALAGESQSLETLLAYLKSPDAETRRDAARRLGERRVRNQLAVEALVVAARKDDDPSVRVEAVEALGKIKDFAALEEMLASLKDDHPDVRLRSVRALVMLYTEHDIDFITNRRAGWNMFNPFLDTSDREIIEPYIVVEPEIINAIGEAARSDGDRTVRVAAIRALGVLRGASAIPQLADALSADQDVRIDVMRTFIKIGDQSAAPHLLQFFRDSNKRVQTQAMVAAGMLRYLPAVEPLLSVYGLGTERKGRIAQVKGGVKGLFSYDPEREEAALWALSLMGVVQAEQTFVENLGDKDPDRRRYAVEGLARIADPRYMDQMSRLLLTEKDGGVKLALHFALYKMGSNANTQFIVRKLYTDQADQARAYLLEANDPADLYPHIKSSNKTVRREVISVLGRIGNRETIKELEPVARTSGTETANTATVAIKQIEWRIAGRPQATDAVIERETRPRRTNNP
jgi:HEAT repeat protein